MKMPDIWGQGSLFAFSGLDGECSYQTGLVGTLCGDRVGVVFHTNPSFTLQFQMTQEVKDLQYEIITSDFIKARLALRSGKTGELHLLFYNQNTVIGRTPLDAPPRVFLEDGRALQQTENTFFINLGGKYVAFSWRDAGPTRYFSLNMSDDSLQIAIEGSRGALNAEWESLINEKLRFYEKLPVLSAVSETVEKLYYKCFSSMKSQIYSPEGIFKTRWTTPDRLPHKNLWFWDSVFHSIGLRYISAELAYESIRSVFDTQREDGLIPHMASPAFSSDITQPPVLAWGIYQLFAFCGNKSYLSDHYGQLKKYLEWNFENRDENQNLLFEWKVNPQNPNCRCDECGMDNSPRFDHVTKMDSIDFSCFMANEARHMGLIAGELGLADEQTKWNELYRQMKQAINATLWDDADRFYYDRELKSGEFRKVKAVSSFLPLFAGVCGQEQAGSLVRYLQDSRYFGTPYPIPSVALEDSTFGTDMWRGPVWINYNYMIATGLRDYGYVELADEILRKTIEMVAYWYVNDGNVYEFYDSTGKKSPRRLNRKGRPVEPADFRIRTQCIHDYGWSCSLMPEIILKESHSAGQSGNDRLHCLP